MLINEFSKCNELGWQQGIHLSEGWSCILIEIDLQVVRSMQSKRVSFSLVKDICKVVILFQNRGESPGIEERSGRVGSDVEEARAETSLRLSINCCVPGSSQAHRNATALTREMSTFGMVVGVSGISRVGSSSGMSLSNVSELSEFNCSSISSETVACMEGLGSDTGFSLSIAGKVILLNTQSINGL